jgi:hypothetical protein
VPKATAPLYNSTTPKGHGAMLLYNGVVTFGTVLFFYVISDDGGVDVS